MLEHNSPCAGFARLPAQGMLTAMVSDEQLMQQYQAGDGAAFDSLYEKYRADVYRYLLRQFDAGTAEELYHDIWIKLIQARQQYTPSASFRTYLYTITHNRVRDHWRKQVHQHTQQLDTNDDTVQTDHINPEQINNDRQAVAALLEGIKALPAEQQQAFLLKVQSGLSVDVIAEVMQTSKESTKSRLRYATQKLREHLKGIWP